MRIQSHRRLFSYLVAIVAPTRPINTPKRMHVALGIDVPHRIVTFKAVEEIETVKKIPYSKENEDEKTKFGRHRLVKDADDTRLKMN